MNVIDTGILILSDNPFQDLSNIDHCWMSVISTGFNGNTQDMLNWYTVSATYPTFTTNTYNDSGIHFVRNYNPVEFNANVYAENILPRESNVYTLGDPNNIWKSLYVGSGTIYLGDATISTTGFRINTPGGIRTASIEAIDSHINVYSSMTFTFSTAGYYDIYNMSYGEYPIFIPGGHYDYGYSLDIALATYQGILASNYVYYSDVRIKKNIVDVDDDMALNYIRQIEPKIYQYIDYKSRGTSNVFGFIAQQIANVLPYATSKILEFIPDVYSFANCIPNSNNTTKLVFTSNIYTKDLFSNSYIKLIDPQNNLIYANITIIEDANIYIDKLISYENVFVFGKLVNDFVSLDKNAIFTVGISAIQDLDKITSNTNVNVTSLQSTVQTMQAQIAALTARVTALENK